MHNQEHTCIELTKIEFCVKGLLWLCKRFVKGGGRVNRG